MELIHLCVYCLRGSLDIECWVYAEEDTVHCSSKTHQVVHFGKRTQKNIEMVPS